MELKGIGVVPGERASSEDQTKQELLVVLWEAERTVRAQKPGWPLGWLGALHLPRHPSVT